MSGQRFFAMHRHYMFDIVLACQFDRQIDRQIRSCVEYEYKHRKVKNFKLLGWLAATIAGGNLFLVYESWYATRDKTGVGNDLIRFSSRVAALYDTFGSFADDVGSVVTQTATAASVVQARKCVTSVVDAPPSGADSVRTEVGAGGPPPRPDEAAPHVGLFQRVRQLLADYFARNEGGADEDADTAIFARLAGQLHEKEG